MLSRLYRIFIAPRQTDRDMRNREIVLNVLLASTLALLVLALSLLVFSYIALKHEYVVARTSGLGGAILFTGGLYLMTRRGHFRPAAALLVGLYFLIASTVAYRWGIVTPTAVLLFGLVIVLAGMLLGPTYSIYAVLVITALLTTLQLLAEHNSIHPDWSWLSKTPTLSDIFGSFFIFAVLAMVSWLFNQQMERSLHLAEKAEAALTKQKESLETTVKERTRELQAAQLEKIQQMYRFAELGQLSTALMHELANHLSSLTINIESLHGETRSKVLAQATRTIRHIDEMVVRVRDQLHGRANIRTFNVASEIEEIVRMLRHRGQLHEVKLVWDPPANKKALVCRGEPIRFRQMIANLICNGVDAYNLPPAPGERREVLVTIQVTLSELVITIEDWGRGIPVKQRAQLFEPFHSTKETGMGMGLFIVRQIAEEEFLGSAALDTAQDHTSFVVRLPKVIA